jgi:hypothetical protein
MRRASKKYSAPASTLFMPQRDTGSGSAKRHRRASAVNDRLQGNYFTA